MSGEKTEAGLRKRLGIPADAERVIIFSESSHWDPNWLLTSREYYGLRIRRIMDDAIETLRREPRRVFSLECIFFLKMYFDRNPDRQDELRRLVNEGRLRLTGSGITTPDTAVPSTEAIIRDYLIGHQWLRNNGMTQQPTLAYLPDDFGIAPGLPTILASLGYKQTAFCRIDGSYFPGSDYAGKGYFPRPGSSAELLTREHKCADFVWQGPDGSSVLAHWCPYTYGQGDSIAAFAPIRWMGITFGIPARSSGKVAKKIKGYARRLAKLSRTPYLLCPIGMDFNGPLPGLIKLLDEYNRLSYPETGVYAINAGMDDYMDLVEFHRGSLPTLDLDLTPYWTGFYSARPEMKHRCARLTRELTALEKILAVSPDERASAEIDNELAPAWYTTVVANHHDFITGTSPDRVWKKEQLPWLVEAQERIDAVAKKAPMPKAAKSGGGRPPKWRLEDSRLTAESGHYIIEVSGATGGCMVSWKDPADGTEMLSGPGAEPASFRDSGGLWRMGLEYRGGEFSLAERASDRQAAIEAKELDHALHVVISSELDGRPMRREMWLRDDSPFIRQRLIGSAGKRKTVTVGFASAISRGSIDMDVAGGVVRRPLEKIYKPTFWAASSFAHLFDESGRGLALFMGGPASVSANKNGLMECVALRNAPRERAFGFLPMFAHPSYGADPDEHPFDFAFGFTRRGDWRENKLHLIARSILRDSWFDPSRQGLEDFADSAAELSNDDAALLALKRAGDGEGLIARLQSFGSSETTLGIRGREVTRAVLCDALEREHSELPVESGRVKVAFTGAIATVRLFTRGA